MTEYVGTPSAPDERRKEIAETVSSYLGDGYFTAKAAFSIELTPTDWRIVATALSETATFDKIMQAKKSGYDEGRIMGLEEAAASAEAQSFPFGTDYMNAMQIAQYIRALKNAAPQARVNVGERLNAETPHIRDAQAQATGATQQAEGKPAESASSAVPCVAVPLEETENSVGDWQCRDYADGWITFPDRKAAEKYRQQTGAMMRYRRRLYPAQV